MIDISRFVDTLHGKPVAVFGLGRSGLSVVAAIKRAGGAVLAWDDHPAARQKAEHAGAAPVDFAGKGFAGCACLVLAPGVPLSHPVVAAAQKSGLEILGDIEILHRCGHGRKTIGITGTNGKSTTTALIAHVLKSCGKSVSCGGNIGTPALDLDMPVADGFFVLELSSYQLDLCPSFAPDIGVILNLTADHIDRHGTIEDYARAKARIFTGPGIAVIGTDDPWCRDLHDRVKAVGQREVLSFSTDDGFLKDTMAAAILKGVHNYQNALAAYHACRAAGLDDAPIRTALQSFSGLPHRQFPVRVIGEVTYINDSKATNAPSASHALAAYQDIYWILGGRAKEGGLEGLDLMMPHVRHAFLIGEAEGDFARWLKKKGVAYTLSKTLDAATKDAHDMAQGSGGPATVLLSPACASFDQFSSYEERGDCFTALVNALAEGHGA
jgi:UDP-N-acetylmuramoylalanine--D-glutamate ligase